MLVNPRSNKESRISLIVDITVKKQMKGAAKGVETSGIGDSRGGSRYDTKATGGGLGVDVDWGDSGNQGEPTPTPTPTTPTGGTGSNYGVSGATTTGVSAPSPTIGGLMGGVGGWWLVVLDHQQATLGWQ
jgi:hypothetical protein